MDNYFLALGTVFATMLVLAPTLIILPIQRASEAWSHVILYLYKKDRTLRRIFILMAASCVLCFLAGFPKIYDLWFSQTFIELLLKYKRTIPIIACVILCINIWQLYKLTHHVVMLLDPMKACDVAVEQAKKEIKAAAKNAKKYELPWYRWFVPITNELLKQERDFYASDRIHKDIMFLCEGIALIGVKAAEKQDIYSVDVSISSLIDVGRHYIKMRKKNFRAYDFSRLSDDPEVVRCVPSDVEYDVISPICQLINRTVSDLSNLNKYTKEMEKILGEYRCLVADTFSISEQIGECSSDLVFTSFCLEDFKKFIKFLCAHDDEDNTYTKLASCTLEWLIKLDLPKTVFLAPEYFSVLHILYSLKECSVVNVRLSCALFLTLTLITAYLGENRVPNEFNQRLILYLFSQPTQDMLVDVLTTNYDTPIIDLPKNWSITRDYEISRTKNITMMLTIVESASGIVQNDVLLDRLGIKKMRETLVQRL